MDSDPAKEEEFIALVDFAQGEYMVVAYGRQSDSLSDSGFEFVARRY